MHSEHRTAATNADESMQASSPRGALPPRAERRGLPLWAKFILGALWAPIAAEIFLRIFAPVPMLPRYVMAGPHGVRANMPSETYRHRSADFDVTIRTNAQGMRADRDFSLEKPANTIRIAVLGDSFGMGYEVSLEETSLAHLERLVAESTGCSVEVLNFSVSGHGPSEQLVVLEAEALRYKPDLVIQMFHPSDILDDVRSRLYKLDGDILVRDAKTYLPGTAAQEYLFSFPSFRWISGECNLYNLLRDKLGNWGKRILFLVRQKSASASTANEAEDAGDDAAGKQVSGTLTARILVEMGRKAEAAGARFMVASIPLRSARDRFKDQFPQEHAAFPYTIASPLERFEGANGQLLYHERSHNHLTPLGCKLLGEAMAEVVIGQSLVTRRCNS